MTNDEVEALDELMARVKAALAEMDRSMYGDPEVPFRMRALLEGRVYA
jgi:hypothetical protein